MKNKIIFATLLSGFLLASAHASDSGKWSIGGGVSTLGAGINVGYKLNESFKLRGILNYFNLNRSLHDDQFNSKGTLQLFTAGILGDLHVCQNGFRLTGGLVYNGNKLDMDYSPRKNVTINGRTYTPQQLGNIKGTLNFRPIAPYLGIGYDSGHQEKSGISFTVDAGVLFQGNVHGKVNSITGLAVNKRQAISDAKDEIVRKANNIGLLKVYPVISLGISYKF